MTSTESYKGNDRKAFYGKCLVIVQSTDQPGKIQLTATSPGLSPGLFIIQSEINPILLD